MSTRSWRFLMCCVLAGVLFTCQQASAFLHTAQGRFLQRDPLGYVDGMSQYQLDRSNPVVICDSDGTWGRDVHNAGTSRWAKDEKYPSAAAEAIGAADDVVDSGATDPVTGDQSYHFDETKGKGTDTRTAHYRHHLKLAIAYCNWRSAKRDDAAAAAKELGTALHPLQDTIAHGDFGWAEEGRILVPHNIQSPQRNLIKSHGDPYNYPDDPTLDIIGGYIRTPGRIGTGTFDPGSSRKEYAIFARGTQRIKLIEQLTKAAMSEFRDQVLQLGRPYCKCWEFFGIME